MADGRVEPLSVVIRGDDLQGGVYLAIIVRLVCDYGLQMGEHIIYQVSTNVCDSGGSIFEPVSSESGQLSYRLSSLSDALPPSLLLAMGPGCLDSWGLTYYLCLFKSSAVLSTPWEMIRRTASSKVVTALAIRRLSPGPINSPPISINATKAVNLLLKSSPDERMSLRVTLDRSHLKLLQGGNLEEMLFKVDVYNPGHSCITSIQINLKQVLRIRWLGQKERRLKNTFSRHQFGSLFSDAHGGVRIKNLSKEASSFSDEFKVKAKIIHPIPYQLALQPVLPRNGDSLWLAPSMHFNGSPHTNLKLLAIEYYANVHVVLRWGMDLIAKVPFTVYCEDKIIINTSVGERRIEPKPTPRVNEDLLTLDELKLDEVRLDENALGLLDRARKEEKKQEFVFRREDLDEIRARVGELSFKRRPDPRLEVNLAEKFARVINQLAPGINPSGLIEPLLPLYEAVNSKPDLLLQWLDTLEVLLMRLNQNIPSHDVMLALRELSLQSCPSIYESIYLPIKILSICDNENDKLPDIFMTLVNEIQIEGTTAGFAEYLQNIDCLRTSDQLYWHHQFILLVLSRQSYASLIIPLIDKIVLPVSLPSYYKPYSQEDESLTLKEWQSRVHLCANLVIQAMQE